MSGNMLPENWTLAKLGDIAEIVGGGTPDRKNTSYFGGHIPWVSPTDITKLDDIWIDTTAESITESGLKHSSAVLLPVGSVLMTCRASFGLVAINRHEMCTSQSLYSFVCNEGIVFNEYLARYLVFIRGRLALLSGETTFKGISKSTLSKVEILLPPLPEQRRIATILREADEIHKLRRRVNEKMQQVNLAIFKEMFELSIRQSKYTTVKLSEVGSIRYGLTVNSTRENLPERAPYLRVANVFRGRIDIANLAIIGVTKDELEKYALDAGDVLVVEGHADPNQIGRAALWQDEVPGCLHQNHLLRIRPDIKKLSPFYLMNYLNSSFGMSYMLRYAKTSSGLNTINSQVLADMPIAYPPFDSQKDFERRYLEYESQYLLQPLATTKFDSLFQSLLARAFTGELTATWREQHAEELAQAARERDHLLMQLRLAPAELVVPAQPTRSEISERQELLALLNGVQRALLAMINEQLATYYTANSAQEELVTIECSLDIVRRELHFLAAAGWIKEQSLPAEAEAGSTHYIPVYRSLLPDDDSQQPDIDQLITRLGSEYPDEVLV